MADLGIEPWGDEPTFHAPVFVVTHRPAQTIERAGGTSYTFVTGGIEDALGRARDVTIELRPVEVRSEPLATHLVYEVDRSAARAR